MTDKSPQDLLKDLADKVLPDQNFLGDVDLGKVFPLGADDGEPTKKEDQLHDLSDKIQSGLSDSIKQVREEVSKLIPSEMPEVNKLMEAAQSKAEQYLPELDYPPSTPSSQNRSLDMYSTPDQEDREAGQMRKIDLATESDTAEIASDGLKPIVSPLASPTKDSTAEAVANLATEGGMASSLEAAAAEMDAKQFMEKAENLLADLAPEVDVDQLKDKMENVLAESSIGDVDELKESVEANVADLKTETILDKVTDAVNETEVGDFLVQQGIIAEQPAEINAEGEAMARSVSAVAGEVAEGEAAVAEEQKDASESSTIYEEISEEEGSDPNLNVNQNDLFEEEVIDDDYEEEELVESEEEEEIIDDEEKIVDTEMEGGVLSSAGNVSSDSVPPNDDEINGESVSSASTGGAFLSAIEEGDEHSYQSGDFFAPLPPVILTEGEDETPVEIPANFDAISNEQPDEIASSIVNDKFVEDVQPEISAATGTEISERPIDLDKSVVEHEQLPPGWKSHVDPDSGDTYYYNEETGETTWEIEDISEKNTNQWHEENPNEVHDSLDKEVKQAGEPVIVDETMAAIPEEDSAESELPSSEHVPEKEQSLVGTDYHYGNPVKSSAPNSGPDDVEEERVKELLEEIENKSPLKSPAVLCLLCAICLLVIALAIAIPLALNSDNSDGTDREITFPTRAPSSPEVSTPVPKPRYELVSGPFEDNPNTGFGRSVSLDSGLLVVGLPNEGQGLVRGFQSNQKGDMRSAGDILGEQEGSGFGWDVDVAGTMAAIGSPFLLIEGTPTEAGGVYVYEYNGSGWSQVGETLRGDGDLYAANEAFGSAISLSITDSVYRVVVGAPISNLNDFEIGRVYTFEMSAEDGSGWVGIEATALLGERAGDRFGSSVAISKDGSTFIAGGPGGDLHDDPGVVFVYEYTGKTEEAWELVFSISGSEENERFGASVAMLSDNGDTFAIGAPDYESGSGRIVVYRKEGGDFYQQLGADIVGERGERIGEQRVLGGSVSGDSVQIVVGTAKGRVLRYDYSQESQSWSLLFDELDPDFSAVTSLAVSGAGAASIAVGSEVDGAVSIYATSGGDDGVDPSPEPVPSTPAPVSTPTAAGTAAPVSVPTTPVSISGSPAPSSSATTTTPSPTLPSRLGWSIVGGPFSVDIPESGFGSSIAMSGSLMAVGAPFTLSESGSVHTYTAANDGWLQSDELYGEESSGGFGFALDIGGEGLFSWSTTRERGGEGAAYYYEVSGGILSRVGEPLRGDGAVGGAFGTSVAVSSNRVAIVGSATYSSDELSGRGAFYIFEYIETWNSTALEAGFESGDSLGYAVDIDESGLIVVAGAPGNGAGYASVFEKQGDVWESTLIISGETDGDACGTSVKVLSSTIIAVGAPGFMQGRGRVVVYEKNGDAFEEMTSVVGDEGDGIGSNLQLAGSETTLIIVKSNGTVMRLDFDGASAEWIQISETVDPGFTEGVVALASPPGDPSTFSVGGGQTAVVYRITQP